MARHYFAAMTKTYPMLRDRCAAEPPDAVCFGTTNWPARVAAEDLGIPAIRLVPHFASNETFSLDEQLTQALRAERPAMEALTADRAAFSRTYGVAADRVDPLGEPATALNLVFVPRAFQPYGDSFDARHHFVGLSMGARERAERWEPRDPYAPLVYISLGSVATGSPDFYRRCVAAFADTPGRWR
ncbi:hypothetical protein [Streptomyces oryzae]|uniref:hypothetical protein n=1 Tax=Streptomyces oryzae TaxID=1434886 RepID=UPI0027DB7389|nr:hypothetical protein [Streptomyces oryzae]